MRTIIPVGPAARRLLAGARQAFTDLPALSPGEGRDRLCIAGEAGNYRAGLIAYGQGDVNCSASGR